MTGASFHAKSCNRRLAPVVAWKPAFGRSRPVPEAPFVSCTYVSINATCPDSCRFKPSDGAAGACFVPSSFTRFSMERLEAEAAGVRPEEVILDEVRQIDDAFNGGPIPQDGARGGRDLRLHVGGDAGSKEGARLLAMAARRWRLRGGGAVWTYTHLWRAVPRSAWGEAITVLARVETAKEIEAAKERGYPSAIAVEAFPDGVRAYSKSGSKALIIPCPAETREGVTCIQCRLCLDRELLALNRAIGLKVHDNGVAATVAARRAHSPWRPLALAPRSKQ